MWELRISTIALIYLVFGTIVWCHDEDHNKVTSQKVHYLTADSTIDYKPLSRHRGFFDNDLRTYCYRGNPKTLSRFFETIELQLDIEGDDYIQYEGNTPEEVQEHRDQHRSLFSFNLFAQKRTRLQLSPFQQQCIGIESTQAYRVRLLQVRIDFWRLIQLLLGLVLFLTAEKLSHNALFYYLTGVALGICSSFMLLIWLAGKLVPRRPIMYGVLIGGWTIGIYIIQLLWENLQLIVITYRTYVFWYILITGLLSFFFCYRLGPPKNARSKNIIKWLLQLMALASIYFSSRFEEASAAFIILAIVYHYFPRSLCLKIRAVFLRRFPPKRRLLTNEEYYEEGVRETTKALQELRAFASSPDCKQWKVMSKLNDPLRFAAFVEGASHLRDEEILRFECSKSEDDDDEVSGISLDEQEQIITEQRSSFHRRQVHPSIRRSYAAAARARPKSEELSEDDDDVDDLSTSGFNLRHTPIPINSSRRSLAKGGNLSRSSPTAQRSSVQRTLPRSAKLVAAAQRPRPKRSISTRTFEMQDNSGDSDDNEY